MLPHIKELNFTAIVADRTSFQFLRNKKDDKVLIYRLENIFISFWLPPLKRLYVIPSLIAPMNAMTYTASF